MPRSQPPRLTARRLARMRLTVRGGWNLTRHESLELLREHDIVTAERDTHGAVFNDLLADETADRIRAAMGEADSLTPEAILDMIRQLTRESRAAAIDAGHRAWLAQHTTSDRDRGATIGR